ncbi:hypothetical protein [Commensalibacter nepenthis]|uniref:Uncharacterized protein n=1 Tax=Commensalibacter nepenthis TaxID=3043872 RepID=A0ABT6QAN1_9PROT|nr:hypothetical protein [Commensalibacter sp. TBRC 10068]MDI2113964.1 hypothetical protein [Commensalibacter sp. TBRC 10068]
MNQSQKIRQIIYDRICYDGYISSEIFTPDMIINNEEYEFYGSHAEFLIYHCADDIKLPIEYLKYFPYDEYFFEETPFTGVVLIVRYLKNILNKYFNYDLKIEKKRSITASQFADIMIDIWEQYQREQKIKCP